jgi:Flp pilus assembly protein TadG
MIRELLLRKNRLCRNQNGAALVEFTVVLPFLVFLGLGAFEFSNALYGHHVITTGLRDAARYLARLDDPTAAETAAKQLAVYGEIGGASKRVSWWDVGDITVALTTIANPADPDTGARTYRGPDPIRVVRVVTTATYPGLGFFAVLGLGSTLAINTFHEERVIGD